MLLPCLRDQRPACVTSMLGCRSKERRGDRRQAANAASKLTLQDIRSGAATRPSSSAASVMGAAAAPGPVLSAPVVQPDTPFANASVQVLNRSPGMASTASKGRKHTQSGSEDVAELGEGSTCLGTG